MSGNNELGIIAASSIGQHDNSSGHEEEDDDDHLFIQDSFALAGTSIPATSPIGVSSCVHHLDKSKKHNNVLSRRISKLTKPEMSEHLEMQHLVDCDVDYENPSQIRSASKTSNCCSCPYLGLMLATLSSLFFSLCSVIVKGLVDVNPMELAAFRFVGVLLPAIPIVIWKREDPFPKGRRIMLILRSFVGTTGLMLSFYAFRHMPLADASVVVFSVPVFVAIFARIFLKEPCGFFNIITVCLTLIGVVLITRPPLIFGHAVESLTDSHVETERTDLWGAVAAFSATLFGANAYVLLRALKGLHFSVIMTNFGSFALIQTVTVTWAIGALCLPRCGTDRLLVVALAFLSFGGQILLTLALQMEQAGPVAIARSADIVFAFFWQVLFFNEIPNRYSVGGAVLVTSSVLLTGLRKWALSLPETSNIKKSLGILAM